MADKAIVSLNAIAKLEKGEVDPRLSTITAVQKELIKAESRGDRASGRISLRLVRGGVTALAPTISEY